MGAMPPGRARRVARSGLSRLAGAVVWLLLGVGWIGGVAATPTVFPETHWEESSPESRGPGRSGRQRRRGNHNASVHISARELARLGLLYLNRGRWNDRQLLSAAWVAAATRPQVLASLPSGDPAASPANGAGVYGFNWWANGRRDDGRRLWPGVPSSAFGAAGWNNNRLFVIPDWDIVVVRLGQDQTAGFAITAETWTEFLRRLGAALNPRGTAPQ